MISNKQVFNQIFDGLFGGSYSLVDDKNQVTHDTDFTKMFDKMYTSKRNFFFFGKLFNYLDSLL